MEYDARLERELLQAARDWMLAGPFVIWSYEHYGWWKSERRGYTRDLREAGVYVREEAEEITRMANSFGSVNEAAIPVKAIEEFRSPTLTPET
ncbi:MAG: hypothetical protein M0R22_00975 [Dehalococcoidia bacterium]|jgi:hypothetical protein|nr:hypothetical protein [Dehalococcoidia bacterium]